jgi:hypothetical protein
LTDRSNYQMDIESRIRSRIEAILQNEAIHRADLKEMASQDEPPVGDPLSQERDLYERIIAAYRRTVSELNSVLEENVDFLSAFCRIVETIKEKVDEEEICVDIVRCVLEGFRAEYCGIVFFDSNGYEPLRFEAIREGPEFLRVHGARSLLGSGQFYDALQGISGEGTACLNLPDVYREPRLQSIDWPSVVRSLVCVPVPRDGRPLGAIVLTHSAPAYFRENHLRMLRIVSGLTAHVHLLTSAIAGTVVVQHRTLPPACEPESLSVVLLSFENHEFRRGGAPPGNGVLREIRASLAAVLQERESILLHRDRELLVLLPGTGSEMLPARVCGLRQAFRAWKDRHAAAVAVPAMNAGFATCNSGEDLSRLLEVASAVMLPDTEEEEGGNREEALFR